MTHTTPTTTPGTPAAADPKTPGPGRATVVMAALSAC